MPTVEPERRLSLSGLHDGRCGIPSDSGTPTSFRDSTCGPRPSGRPASPRPSSRSTSPGCSNNRPATEVPPADTPPTANPTPPSSSGAGSVTSNTAPVGQHSQQGISRVPVDATGRLCPPTSKSSPTSTSWRPSTSPTTLPFSPAHSARLTWCPHRPRLSTPVAPQPEDCRCHQDLGRLWSRG